MLKCSKKKENNKTLFSGYYGVIPQNMTVPKALFLSEEQAIEYASGEPVKKYPASSLLFEALCQSDSNL